VVERQAAAGKLASQQRQRQPPATTVRADNVQLSSDKRSDYNAANFLAKLQTSLQNGKLRPAHRLRDLL